MTIKFHIANLFRKLTALVCGMLLSFSVILHANNMESINIKANNQKVDFPKNTLSFNGNVEVRHPSFFLYADNLSLQRDATQQLIQYIDGQGKPAWFEYQTKEMKISAKAQRIYYDLPTSTITLTGNAELIQNNNLIKGHKITYNITQKQLLAHSQDKNSAETNKPSTNRVSTVIDLQSPPQSQQ